MERKGFSFKNAISSLGLIVVLFTPLSAKDVNLTETNSSKIVKHQKKEVPFYIKLGAQILMYFIISSII